MSEAFLDNVVVNENLSLAWAEAFFKVLDSRGNEATPLVVVITGFNNNVPPEVPEIRDALDRDHARLGTGLSCHTTANTIFPKNIWIPDNGKNAFYERYKKILPNLKRCGKNQYGLYSERLMNYEAWDKKAGKMTYVNQLDHVIETFKAGNHRRSALIASVFDPVKDHSDQRQRGFPCLQQVSFVPIGNDGLAINAFYATQYIFDRAYGNYLGLCRLGHFVAHEIGLQFTKMVCFAGVAKLSGKYSKSDLSDLVNALKTVSENKCADG